MVTVTNIFQLTTALLHITLHVSLASYFIYLFMHLSIYYTCTSKFYTMSWVTISKTHVLIVKIHKSLYAYQFKTGCNSIKFVVVLEYIKSVYHILGSDCAEFAWHDIGDVCHIYPYLHAMQKMHINDVTTNNSIVKYWRILSSFITTILAW
jgi:hypothetical protein